MLDHNRIEGTMPEELCKSNISGVLKHIRTDCEHVHCTCCENCNDSDAKKKATVEELKLLSGDKIYDPNTPQYKASDWIIREDKWNYPIELTSYLYQRYVLVLLYFMMGDQDGFKPDPNTDECEWERIDCSHNGYVEHIEFGKYTL